MSVRKLRDWFLVHSVVMLLRLRGISFCLDFSNIGFHLGYFLQLLLFGKLLVLFDLISYLFELILNNCILFLLLLCLIEFAFPNLFQVLEKQVSPVLLIWSLFKENLLGWSKRSVVLANKLI